MTNMRSRSLPKYLGVSLVSASVLALQVVFTRVFSIMIWHHFTYLVVGVALLGGGAAGTYLAIRQWDSATVSRRIGKIAIGFSLSILVDLLVIVVVRFDPLEPADVVNTLVGLALYFVALFTTFFLGGLTVVCAFRLWVSETHRLYFADLLGAGVSTVLVVWLVHSIGGPSAIAFVALLALVAGLMFGIGLGSSGHWRSVLLLVALGQLGLFLFSLVNPIQLPVPKSKALNWALELAGVSEPEYTRWNSVARVDVLPQIHVDVPMIVGGVSSVYLASPRFQAQEGYSLRLVTLDGTSMTALYHFDGDLSRFEFLRHAIIGAPFQVSVDQPSILSIGVGGGLDILLARLYDAKAITAIDLNGDVVALLTSVYPDFIGRLADDPRTTVITAEGRSFLTRDETRYDVIQGIGLDNIAALASGAYVLSESYLYTVEAFDLILDHLTPQGVFAWTRNTSNPPSEMLRLAGMMAEALRRQGVDNPGEHIAIVSNTYDAATIVVSRAPFTVTAVQRLREWVAANQFEMLYDPFERLETEYAAYLDALDARAFEAAYVFNVFPVTDDHPFYYNYFKWSLGNVFDFNRGYDYEGSVHKRFPIGNLILLAMLGFSIVTAIVFIGFPLLRYERRGLKTPYAINMLTYFSALGLGYIFVEIVLIQRFTLFIGYPTHAIVTTIFSLLTFSAIGSLVSERLTVSSLRLRFILLVLAFAIFLYIFALPPLFRALLRLPDAVRVLLSVVLIAPLAFLMGMPFPTGLRRVGVQAKNLVPWAWGVNGVFSVLGSVLVILVSMLLNFTVALASAALIYGLAMVVATSLWKADVISDAAPDRSKQNATHPVTAEELA